MNCCHKCGAPWDGHGTVCPAPPFSVTLQANVEHARLRDELAKARADVATLRAALDSLLRAGQMCSNVCYNLAQRNELASSEIAMRQSYKAWDGAAQAAHAATAPPSQPEGES